MGALKQGGAGGRVCDDSLPPPPPCFKEGGTLPAGNKGLPSACVVVGCRCVLVSGGSERCVRRKRGEVGVGGNCQSLCWGEEGERAGGGGEQLALRPPAHCVILEALLRLTPLHKGGPQSSPRTSERTRAHTQPHTHTGRERGRVRGRKKKSKRPTVKITQPKTREGREKQVVSERLDLRRAQPRTRAGGGVSRVVPASAASAHQHTSTGCW